MIVAYIVLFTLGVFLYAAYYRTKNDTFDIVAIIVGLIATIIAVIANYLAFFMIFGAVSMGGSRGIGWVIGHHKLYNIFNRSSFSSMNM